LDGFGGGVGFSCPPRRRDPDDAGQRGSRGSDQRTISPTLNVPLRYDQVSHRFFGATVYGCHEEQQPWEPDF
jgi:hypothetical protein